jgi:hypothetical protein
MQLGVSFNQPRMRPIGSVLATSIACLVLAIGVGCSGATLVATKATPEAKTAAQGPKWLVADLPGQYSDMRTVVYDQARDCVWVLSRESSSIGSEMVSLSRVNLTDRSTVKLPFTAVANGYDVGLIALDAQGVLWMGWGDTLTRLDPDTGATKSWTRPAYSGLALLYSGDGRMDAMTIDSNGEIWVAAGMVSAVFGFNPKTSTWDRPISLPFVSVENRSELAAPAPGVITINGIALRGGALDPQFPSRFAMITTATRSVKTLSTPVYEYVSIGGGQIVYWDGAGTLVRMSILESTSTVFATAPRIWGLSPAHMAPAADGNVWLPVTTQGFPGVAKLNPFTGAVSQFPFPIVVRYYLPPSPTPCFMHGCLPIECNPTVVFRCIPTPVSQDPGVQGLAPDAHGDLWIVTQTPSLTITEDRFPMGPVVELQPGG